MKKIICILTASVLILMSGCSTTKEKTTGTDTTSSEVTTNAQSEVTEVTTQESQNGTLTELDNYQKKFFDALIAHNHNALADYFSSYPENMSYFDGIEIAGYTPAYADYEKEGYGIYVNLDVTKSDNDNFPVGNNRYLINMDEGVGAVIHIGLASDGQPLDNDMCEIERFCEHTLTLLGLDSTQKDVASYISSLEPDESNIYAMIIMCSPDLGINMKSQSCYEQCEKLFGTKDFDFTKYPYYNKDTDEMNLAGKGGVWNYAKSSQNIDIKDGIATVALDFYADSAYLNKAKSIKYTLKYNNDEDYTLLSTEVTFDSGLKPARAGI